MKKTIKKIGIIGGAGPLASSLLYNKIVEECYKKVNRSENFPEIIIINYPFTSGRKKQDSQKQHGVLIKELQYCIDTLINTNVNILAIACNTLHVFVENINVNLDQFIHLINLVKEKIREQRLKKILILGTQTTIQQKLYENSFYISYYLSSTDQVVLDLIIENLLAGIIIESDARKLENIMEKTFKEMSFEGVVFGCTDLSILLDKFHINLPKQVNSFDTVTILAKELVDKVIINNNFYND